MTKKLNEIVCDGCAGILGAEQVGVPHIQLRPVGPTLLGVWVGHYHGPTCFGTWLERRLRETKPDAVLGVGEIIRHSGQS